MFKNLLYFHLLTLTILPSIVFAQQQQVSLRFLAFPQEITPLPIELLIGEGKTIEVDTPGHELSRRYSVPPLSSIVVGKTITNSEGKAIFQPFGHAKSIAAPEQIILLLRKGNQFSDGTVVLPIAADLNAFKGASFYFINASTLTIKGIIGDQKLEILPGQSSMSNPKPNFEGDICQVTLSYVSEGKNKLFYDTRWPANKNVRSLILFYQNPQTGRLGIAPIMDIIPRPQSP